MILYSLITIVFQEIPHNIDILAVQKSSQKTKTS